MRMLNDLNAIKIKARLLLLAHLEGTDLQGEGFESCTVFFRECRSRELVDQGIPRVFGTVHIEEHVLDGTFVHLLRIEVEVHILT